MAVTKVSIGGQFKKAREIKKLSLEEIYKHTKIHPSVLSAIEEDKFSQILNATYIRSFLKEYADFIGLDADAMVSEYNKAYSKSRPVITKSIISKNKIPNVKKSIFSSVDIDGVVDIAKRAAIFILSVAVIIFLIRSSARIIKNIPKKTRLPAKQEKTLKPKSIPRPKRGETKLAAPQTANQKPQAELPKKSPTKVVRPSRGLSKVSIPAAETLRLTIVTTDDVWLDLKADGKTVHYRVLPKGSSETWEANENFEVWTGNGAAIQLRLNGQELGNLGEGAKKGIIITRQGIKR
jgi:cytoskeletal protein RodZ